MPEGRSSHPCVGPWRRRTASGVVLTAVALGLRTATGEQGGDEAVVTDAPRERPEVGNALDLHFDPRGPDDTWVVVRPWLLGRDPG